MKTEGAVEWRAARSVPVFRGRWIDELGMGKVRGRGIDGTLERAGGFEHDGLVILVLHGISYPFPGLDGHHLC